MIKKDCQIDQLKKELVEQKGRSMRYNLPLHGMSETRGEDCSVTFRDYIGKGTDLMPNQVGSVVIERAQKLDPPVTVRILAP